MPQPYKSKVSKRSSKGRGIRSVEIGALLPHDYFSAIYKYSFELSKHIFCHSLEHLREYWNHERAQQTEWFLGNKNVLEGYNLDFVIPVGLYGDDAAKVKESRLESMVRCLSVKI